MTRHLAVPTLLCVVLIAAAAACGSNGSAPHADASRSAPCDRPPPTTLEVAGAPFTAPNTDVEAQLLSIVHGAVVRVQNAGGIELGTAFRAEGGALVTARHVAASNVSVRLSTSVGADLTATISAVSSGDDLASMTGPAGVGLALAPADPPRASPVWVAGYPVGGALQLVRGTVLNYTSGGAFGESGRLMRSDAPLKSGNSGSPVLDASGQVVGVAFGVESDNSDALIVPVSTVRHFLGASCP